MLTVHGCPPRRDGPLCSPRREDTVSAKARTLTMLAPAAVPAPARLAPSRRLPTRTALIHAQASRQNRVAQPPPWRPDDWPAAVRTARCSGWRRTTTVLKPKLVRILRVEWLLALIYTREQALHQPSRPRGVADDSDSAPMRDGAITGAVRRPQPHRRCKGRHCCLPCFQSDRSGESRDRHLSLISNVL